MIRCNRDFIHMNGNCEASYLFRTRSFWWILGFWIHFENVCDTFLTVIENNERVSNFTLFSLQCRFDEMVTIKTTLTTLPQPTSCINSHIYTHPYTRSGTHNTMHINWWLLHANITSVCLYSFCIIEFVHFFLLNHPKWNVHSTTNVATFFLFVLLNCVDAPQKNCHLVYIL